MKDLYQLFTLDKKYYPLIHDLKVRKLVVNKDDRGNLVEVLKITWDDIYSEDNLPFTQVYYSTTNPGVARDQDQWHFHPGGQVDRYALIFGNAVFAVYDIRENSPTKNLLNLFLMGDSLGDEGQYILLVPPQTLHGLVVVGRKPATLINFPSRLYDPHEEVRLPFSKYPLPDGTTFSWEKVKKAYSSLYK